jgi:hypothetical protein
MGIDGLDIHFRLEKEFGGKLPHLYWSADELRMKKLPRVDPTMGDIHARLCAFLAETHRPVPADSWSRVQKCIGEALAIPPEQIQPHHRLLADLGAT